MIVRGRWQAVRAVIGLAALVSSTACGGATAPPAPAQGSVPADWQYAGPLAVATGTHGMVATDAPIATKVGIEVLRRGGNAVDAAIATAFVLAVVYPEAGNIGGGGFMVARLADGTRAALDFRETAPAAASRDMYLDSLGEMTDRSLLGHQASGVPGSVAGLFAAHVRYGSMPWADLLAPAIRLAEEGFETDADFAGAIRDAASRLSGFEGSSALFLPGGEPVAAGSVWKNPDLAAVLRRIAERGPDGFYKGETADLIVAEMRRGGGLISKADLAGYQPKWREPVAFEYRGHTIVSMPPASSGGITLAMMAGLLGHYDPAALGWHSPEELHLVTESMRRAFADRNEFMADPDFVDVPRERLMSAAYLDSLRATIDSLHATPSSEVRAGLVPMVESDHTTHFSVVDDKGNAVALTTTINELFGSAVTVTGAGFLLNDEMDDFASKPGTPNMFGLVQGEANAIRPGKRMLSAMTPTIVLSPDGSPLLVTGARGGPRIITAVFQVLTNVVDFDLPIDEAVRAPRIHHQHLPDVLYFEAGGLDSATIRALAAMGHHVESRDSYIGNAPSILRRGDTWTGVADPRQGGLAEGY